MSTSWKFIIHFVSLSEVANALNTIVFCLGFWVIGLKSFACIGSFSIFSSFATGMSCFYLEADSGLFLFALFFSELISLSSWRFLMIAHKLSFLKSMSVVCLADFCCLMIDRVCLSNYLSVHRLDCSTTLVSMLKSIRINENIPRSGMLISSKFIFKSSCLISLSAISLYFPWCLNSLFDGNLYFENFIASCWISFLVSFWFLLDTKSGWAIV